MSQKKQSTGNSVRQLIRKKRESLEAMGIDVKHIGDSGLMSDYEVLDYLSRVEANEIRKRTSISTKLNKNSEKPKEAVERILLVSDIHSEFYKLEPLLQDAEFLNIKILNLGDNSDGASLAGDTPHHKTALLYSPFNLSHDMNVFADQLSRYKDSIIGGIEGNHDLWASDLTSINICREACRLAKISEKYAKHMQIVTRKVRYDDKDVPFNFLIVHGEGMPAKVINALKSALDQICSYNVDAMFFGHTHVQGSASATIMSRNSRGKWTERSIMAYNPGTLQESAEYADRRGYAATAPYDAPILRFSVVPTADGKGYKKCIDVESINELMPDNYRKTVNKLRGQISKLKKKKYNDMHEIDDDFYALRKEYLPKEYPSIQFKNGQHIISISGTCDMFNPDTPEEIKALIKTKLIELVNYVKDINNLSIVLNGDLLYDYNKGFIVKKDYSAEIFAEIQQLGDILKPVADKVVAINYGRMEEGIMKFQVEKAKGRYSSDKDESKGLANYSMQTSQMDETQAYEPYNKVEMQTKKLAVQNSQVNEDNQKVLDRAFDDFMRKVQRDKNALNELDEDLSINKLNDVKKIKDALVKKLRKEHKILDTSNEEDRKIINERYPLAYIDLRIPNHNLIGNVFCKLLGVDSKKVKCNNIINAPSIFKIDTANGDQKVVYAYYAHPISKFSKNITAKLNRTQEPPDLVLVNNYSNNDGDLMQYTTKERKIYMKNVTRKTKDIPIINSGSFRFSKLYTNNKVTTPKIYKIGEADPIITTSQPKTSINYKSPKEKELSIHTYEPESVNLVDNHIKSNIERFIDKSHIETIDNYYDSFRKTKTPNHVENEAKRYAEEASSFGKDN